jgi:cation:H+ antiporter
MWIAIVLFIVGFVLTVFGANWLVSGASSLAAMFRISNLVIGLTVVAFGTSMPEFVVSFFAAVNGNTDIAVGNVVGSNVFNTLGILGLSALIYPIAVQRSTVWAEIPISLLAAVVLMLLANDSWISPGAPNMISLTDGLILLVFFGLFMFYSFRFAAKPNEDDVEPVNLFPVPKSFFLVIIGLAGLVGGGHLMVTGAVDFAKIFGISEAIIGLTIVSVGTSVPELATSLVAAYRKNSDIAIGNVVGSNIFNIFFILGVSSAVAPLPFQKELNSALYMCIGSALLLFFFMFVGKPRTLSRWQGSIFFLIYVGYTVYLCVPDLFD